MAPLQHPLDVAAHAVGGRKALASALGVTVAALGNWKARGVPVRRCMAIVRRAMGCVTLRDLRPDDWREIWPELAESEEKQATALSSKEDAAIKPVAQEAAHG